MLKAFEIIMLILIVVSAIETDYGTNGKINGGHFIFCVSGILFLLAETLKIFVK